MLHDWKNLSEETRARLEQVRELLPVYRSYKEKAPGGMKRQADKENPGGIISLRGLLSSSRKLPRSTKLSQPRLFLLQLDLQRVNAAPERRDLLSAALAALLRALIAPNLFAAGLWNTNLRRRLKFSTLLR